MTKPRDVREGIPAHIRHRANQHLNVFVDDEDREWYLELLRRESGRYDLEVHHFSLMDTHSHVLATPRREKSLTWAMQILGQRYSRFFNRKHNRRGTLWFGPFESKLVDDDRYVLTCARYIEQNPVRARLVSVCEDYRWSSYRIHALGEVSDWIVPHPVYLSLGNTPESRQSAYRALCAEPVQTSQVVRLRVP
jgi:REP-associated tyrosine transposase